MANKKQEVGEKKKNIQLYLHVCMCISSSIYVILYILYTLHQYATETQYCDISFIYFVLHKYHLDMQMMIMTVYIKRAPPVRKRTFNNQ